MHNSGTDGMPRALSPRKSTFLQLERWKDIPKAKRKEMSVSAIEQG